jgi:hypothetical protein
MALNRGIVNALNVLGFRKLSFIPEHFLKISIDHKFDTKLVEQWIEFNLNSRYAIQVKQGIDSNRKLVSITEIGMEDPKELTMLSLGCHHLHKQKEF